MGGILSNLCDCTHKDPRTEINMFLTQNQTIQFSSPLENIKTQRKEPLTNRSASTYDNSRQKINDYNINTTFIKLKNDKKNILYNNKLPKKKNIFNEPKKNNSQIKQNNNNKLNSNNYIPSRNNNTLKTFNSNYTYCSKKSLTNKEFKNIIESKGNSDIYIGEKKGKIKEGLGLQKWNKDTFFFGNYKDNKINGIGKFISGKTKYKGEFKENGANGFGIYTTNKLAYEGYWNSDLQSNFGIEKWKDGSTYKGQYYNGKKNGIGTYIFGDGNKYEGEFINNAFNGYGIYYFNENGKYYLGQWSNNEKNGYGELITNDKIYMGFYLKDKRHGFGLSFLKKRKKFFMGFWKNGYKLGPFKEISQNSTKYGIIDKEGNIIDIKDENNEFLHTLEKEGLIKYKKFFRLSFEDISTFINDNVFYELIYHK